MLKFKRLLPVFLVALMLISTATVASAAKVAVKVDGVTVATDVAPALLNGDALVSLKTLQDALGVDASYSASQKTITVKSAAHSFKFALGNADYDVDGTVKTAAAAPKLVSKKPLVSIKAVVEGMGGTVIVSSKTLDVSYFSKMSGNVKITGSTTLQPIAQAAADTLNKMNSGLTISVAGGGSGAGINDTIDGTNNLGMSSRSLKDDEKAKISSIAVANDGIAVIVHPSNPVKNLTKEQAEKIFLGEIKNWSEVGGNDAPILVQTRETGSGTRATLEEMLLEKKSIVESATPSASSALIKQAVAREKNAVGYDSVGFVDKSVKAIALDNIIPTEATVKDSSYMMGRALYLLTKDSPKDASAMFVDYLKTADCQKSIVAKEGYIKLR